MKLQIIKRPYGYFLMNQEGQIHSTIYKTTHLAKKAASKIQQGYIHFSNKGNFVEA